MVDAHKPWIKPNQLVEFCWDMVLRAHQQRLKMGANSAHRTWVQPQALSHVTVCHMQGHEAPTVVQTNSRNGFIWGIALVPFLFL